MSFCDLTAIEGYCSKAVAALRYVTLYVPSDLDVEPDWNIGVYSAQEPVLLSGKTSYTIPFDKFSASLRSRPDSARAGDFWQHSIDFRIRRNREEVGLWLLRMRNRRFHLVTEDWYGVRMWWPNMRLATERTHEERFTGVNGFAFSFSRGWQHPGVYLLTAEDPSNAPGIWGDGASEQWGSGSDVWGWE